MATRRGQATGVSRGGSRGGGNDEHDSDDRTGAARRVAAQARLSACRPLCEMAGATVKASAILGRGSRALQAAASGMVWMALEETAAASRALARARTPREFIELEACVASHSAGRTVRRWLVLSTMATEVVEDAVFPLVRGTWTLLDRIEAAAAA